jgi:hypothetical protein
MKQSEQSIPPDLTSALLRLYLEWPEIGHLSPNAEANEFYLWLQNELGDDFSQLVTSLNEIKSFINDHHHVLSTARYFKGRVIENAKEGRSESRVEMQTQVFFMIYDCQEAPLLEGTVNRGILVDIAPNGLRIESHMPIPAGTLLSLTVAQANWDIRLYHLTGEVRWTVEHEYRHQTGIVLFHLGDYDDWQDYYELTKLSS